MHDVWALVDSVDIKGEASDRSASSAVVWVGSIGYERHKDSREFAHLLAEAGVERLVDVRELPISRRRGYAKTALGAVIEEAGMEYVHFKALGNPKPFRDLYKSGRAAEGKQLYEAFLLAERTEALKELSTMITDKRTALMCVEDDPCVCHRTVIIDSLQDSLGLDLEIADLG